MNADSTGKHADTQGEMPRNDNPFDLQPLDQILEQYQGHQGAVIPILQKIQETFGYLPPEILEITSERTGIPISQLYGVATFYAQFHLKRQGRHLIRICDGTACHVKGSTKVVQAIENALALQPASSSPDYKYTLEIVYCLGSCGLAPVAIVNEKVYGQIKPEPFVRILKKLE